MTSAIRTESLYKTYPGQPPQVALHALSIDIAAGELVVLLGPNGAGKTTLFKILATLLQPTGGEVQVAGHSLADSLSVRRSIGMVSDPDRSFFWRLNAYQNLEFFASAYGLGGKAGARRLADLVEQLDLAEFAAKPVGQLSSGQRGRLALARALLHHPPILLLDEPTRSLDPAAADRFLQLLAAYRAQSPNATVLLSTHRLDAVASYCQRLLILDHGQLQADGAPAYLLAQAGLAPSASRADDLGRLYRHFTGQSAPISAGVSSDPWP